MKKKTGILEKVNVVQVTEKCNILSSVSVEMWGWNKQNILEEIQTDYLRWV